MSLALAQRNGSEGPLESQKSKWQSQMMDWNFGQDEQDLQDDEME